MASLLGLAATMTQIPALNTTDQLLTTAKFCAAHAGMALEVPGSAAWLVSGACALAQQASALALKAAGDTIPVQVGATELLLRAASKDRLPPPYALPFSTGARRDFDRLVESRNSFLHPRGVSWHVSPQTLARGLPVVTAVVRHLLLVQPIKSDIVSSIEAESLEDALDDIEALSVFLADDGVE